MSIAWTAFIGAARAELLHLRRSKLLIGLTIVQAVTFLVLVSLFGITGARAPTAIIDKDRGALAHIFISCLQGAHHSFDLKFMDEERAMNEIARGNLVAVITIPPGFTEAIKHRGATKIDVLVDNINTDMTEDIQRALPSAIVSFSQTIRLPFLRLSVAEKDLIPHDTDFIPYLVVSALVSASLIISGILAAVATSNEYESGTAAMLALAPVHPLVPLLGRVCASSLVAAAALAVTVALAIFGYGIKPVHPIEMCIALLVCTLIFAFAGMALGSMVKRSLPVASIVFGMALPLYMISGSYEPERFDGNLVWAIAHGSPVYYAVGILEHAALGLRVTPESVLLNFLALGAWAVLSLSIAAVFVRRRLMPC